MLIGLSPNWNNLGHGSLNTQVSEHGSLVPWLWENEMDEESVVRNPSIGAEKSAVPPPDCTAGEDATPPPPPPFGVDSLAVTTHNAVRCPESIGRYRVEGFVGRGDSGWSIALGTNSCSGEWRSRCLTLGSSRQRMPPQRI